MLRIRRPFRLKKPRNRSSNPLTKRWAQPFSKQKLLHAARVMGPTLVALAFAGVAHAQGTMDFSGAQTLMTTFKTFAIYAGAVICFGGLIFAGIRMMSGRFQDAIPGLFGALFGAGVLGWGAGWIGTFVENTPLNGRSFQDLILLTPGVVTQNPQGAPVLGGDGDFSVNGQRTNSNYYMVDGVSANTSPGVFGQAAGAGPIGGTPSGTALGTTQSLVSIDALQEFRISSSTYSAEYGRNSGAQISFVTRSGTNDLHGSIFDYLRNNYFDANDWFSDYYKTAQPALRQNDFGGTLGGPIRIPGLYDGKGKSFFFVSYEGLRLAQPQAATLQYVPSLALRQNPTLPSVMAPLLNAFPLPTVGGQDHGNGLADFIQADSLPSQIDSTSFRIDHSLSSRVKLFFRFSDAPSSTATRISSVYQPVRSDTQTYTLGATAQLRDNLSNEFRLGYTHSDRNETDVIDSFGGAQPINIAQAMGIGTTAMASSSFIFLAPGTGEAYLEPSIISNRMNQWNVTDSLAWLHGHHQFKFGIDYREIGSTGSPTSPFALYLYESEGAILSNKAAEGEGIARIPGKPVLHQFSAFAQDEFRINSRLTLSAGLRWDLLPPPGATDGNIPYTLLGNIADPSTLSLAPKGTQPWKTTWFNFAPRLGVAWIANSSSSFQTVFRAGGGVFFDDASQAGVNGYNGIGFYASKIVKNAPVPYPGGVTFSPSLTPPYTSSAIYYPNPHLQLPDTLEWSAAIEQSLGRPQTLTITYVGANGRRLLTENEYSVNTENPNFNEIFTYENQTTSNYQALQVKFQRSVVRGVQALASYSWSHSIDYGSNFAALSPLRGNSDFDVRNSLSAGATWALPTLKSNRFLQAVVNAWALDGHFIARTAFPVTLQGNTITDPATGTIYTGNVDLVPNQPIYLHINGIPGNREINPAAFSTPTGDQNGDAPRNFVRGFGATQLNLAVRREFHLRERLALQFRAETFNLLNHPNFGLIDSDLTDATFGQATQTLSQSLTTVSPLYQMGGPRSMQFALRLQF